MSRLLIEIDQPKAIQNTERRVFLDKAKALLEILDADSFRAGEDEDHIVGSTLKIRIDGPPRGWNRVTFYDTVTDRPLLNAVMPEMVMRRLMPRSRFDAARSILTTGIVVSDGSTPTVTVAANDDAPATATRPADADTKPTTTPEVTPEATPTPQQQRR